MEQTGWKETLLNVEWSVASRIFSPIRIIVLCVAFLENYCMRVLSRNLIYAVLVFSSLSRRRLANADRCLVAETFPHLVFCDNVRDLGIILDQELNFSAHINKLTRSCFFVLSASPAAHCFSLPIS